MHENSPQTSLSQRDLRRAALLNALENGGHVLFDGGLVTVLYEKGIFINRSFDEVNLIQPELVQEIHEEYLASGAQVITTNTWGANRVKLQRFGLENKIVEINTRGTEIARSVAGHENWVAGSIGPLGIRIEPWGPTSFAEARAYFFEQAQALANAGVDLFVLESFGDLNEIREAIAAVKQVSDYPIVAMMTTNEEGSSMYGTEPEWFVKKLDEWGAHVVGVNGGNGPIPLLELFKRLRSGTQKPIILKPNAGSPRMVDGRLIYMASPEYMGEFAKQALIQGVSFLGGCSGTTPAHIRAMSAALRQERAFELRERALAEIAPTTSPIPETAIPQKSESLWHEKISNGKFVFSMELLPPKGLDPQILIQHAQRCRESGVHAINIPDGPRASARMSALAAACLVERDAKIETVLHFACRDRNLLGMQSDLIGASALGIRNILCITGDPPKLGRYPNSTAVFDIDSIGLVNMITRLNCGFDLGGSPLGNSPKFSVGVGVNPVAPDMEREKERFKYKVEAGAQWAITQPVFDSDSLFRFLDFASKFSVPIIAGIWPLVSMRNAEFMANEVPGVFVPPAILERMRACSNAAEQRAEGLLIAQELIESIKSSVQGLQVSVPGSNLEWAIQLAKNTPAEQDQ